MFDSFFVLILFLFLFLSRAGFNIPTSCGHFGSRVFCGKLFGGSSTQKAPKKSPPCHVCFFVCLFVCFFLSLFSFFCHHRYLQEGEAAGQRPFKGSCLYHWWNKTFSPHVMFVCLFVCLFVWLSVFSFWPHPVLEGKGSRLWYQLWPQKNVSCMCGLVRGCVGVWVELIMK